MENHLTIEKKKIKKLDDFNIKENQIRQFFSSIRNV